jgi:hypothetical protein
MYTRTNTDAEAHSEGKAGRAPPESIAPSPAGGGDACTPAPDVQNSSDASDARSPTGSSSRRGSLTLSLSRAGAAEAPGSARELEALSAPVPPGVYGY